MVSDPTAPLAPLLDLLGDAAELVAERSPVVVPSGALPAVVAGLVGRATAAPLILAVPGGDEAEQIGNDLGAFLGRESVEVVPAWETLPFERISPSVETMGRRLRAMWRLRTGDPSLRIVVASARALVQRLGPHAEDVDPIEVHVGGRLDIGQLVTDLVASGYRREYQVEHRGEVAVRGSIVDVFGSTDDAPVRIDLWGDEVDRLCHFSVADQRSGDALSSARFFGARELTGTDEVRRTAAELVGRAPWGREHWERLAEGAIFEGMEAWLPWLVADEHVLFDLLGADAEVVIVDPGRFRARAQAVHDDEVDLALSLARTWGLADADDVPRLTLGADQVLSRTDAPVRIVETVASGPDTPGVMTEAWAPVVGDGEALVRQLRRLLGAGLGVVATADGPGTLPRIRSILTTAGFTLAEPGRCPAPPGSIATAAATLERGCVLPSASLAILAETDLTGRRRTRRPAARARRDAQQFFESLEVGSYVVHEHHGVARFGGMVRRAVGGVERDYLLCEYRGADRLYVPSDQIDSIRLYSGGETPTLNKMGGADFARTKAKVRAAVAQIAQELVVLYQRRLHTAGHPFSGDTTWQHEVEQAFPYQETPDQLRAIADVKADMESPVPMDRLVCGDVGFGKTEVAVRAVFKAVADGKQAAVLVPTTLLAQQHHQTFTERLAGQPVRVEMLSRFLTDAEARDVISGLASGAVDVVIGTHRLLSGDIRFADLGLLVVDEEQRFGVSAKESIKQLRTNVDVLTLTATPIPRTLEMSLTGIRDLSLLETPPAARQPILTYVGPYDERAVAEAIRRELLREGQVFYVHNRVRDIEQHAAELRELVPEARVAVAHGQMDETRLERVVTEFWEGHHDVLVCTTIIESGIDMPMVNTLVVERADLLGLGQLHQLRGRVGRAGQRAYAYLFHPPDLVLSEEADERLRTIGETTELGSGFRIAMRDLEIRGAGNLLGTGQSGHVASVGYDLYCQMVTEAINELNGTVVPEPVEVTVEVPVAAYIPEDYIAREDLRLEAYRRLAALEDLEEVDSIQAEWVDRFGPVPEPAVELLGVARLRALCLAAGISELVISKGPGLGGPPLVARIAPVVLTASRQVRLERTHQGARYKEESSVLLLPVAGGTGLLERLGDSIRELILPAGAGAGAEGERK
ncbi:MAG: transcription-repair coupling factor [Actinobacteria bacterium]|nr:transcription-repair coupling factor [Actinomycetota bacterium]